MSESERTTTWVPLILVVVLALAGVLFTVFSPDGLLRWYRLRQEVAKLSAENEQLRQTNESLRAESKRLATDRTEIERTVRTDLGYVKSDEIVFKFAPSTTADTKVKR
jgi:cell division protein FtsB